MEKPAMFTPSQKILVSDKAERQSNFELLRIISMIFIVGSHYSVHNAVSAVSLPFGFNKILLQFMNFGGKYGVNLFVLISGYFLVSQEFKIKKAIKLWLDVTVYSVVITAVFMAFGTDIGIIALKKYIFPILYNQWWFATSYFVLLIFSPFINIFIRAADRKTLDKLIIALVVICYIMPSFLGIKMAQSNLTILLTLYLIAARIRLYQYKHKIFSHSLAIGAVLYVITQLSAVAFDIIGLKISIFNEYAVLWANDYSILLLLSSVFLFIGFKNIKIKPNKAINTSAAAAFGVYLIHEHNLVRPFLWKNIFNITEYSDSLFLIVHAFIAVVSVFAVCTAISCIYNKTLGKLVNSAADKISSALMNFFKGKELNI